MTKKNDSPAREIQYAAAASWGTDLQEAARRSRRTAWTVAAGLGLIALFEALALMLLAPIKTVVPYTILVDRQTGFVQAVDPMAPTRLSAQSALTRAFVAQYVVARESYDADTARTDYQKVALLSEGAARSRYIAAMQPENPESPIARFGRGRRVSAVVKSVSPLSADTALVRFDTLVLDSGGATRLLGSWAAVLKFRYRDVPMRASDRLLNPLGFTVTSYRRDPEAPPPAPAAAPDAKEGA